MKKFLLFLSVLLFISAMKLVANKTSVEIKAPAEVKNGSEVTLVINVMHKGNSKSHFTDWVVLKINGKEVQRWKYDKNTLPAGENFTLEYKFMASENITVECQGHCNLHGSTGTKNATIKVI
jgi:desulfoferrodoxin (superoxide reductase-like protein)